MRRCQPELQDMLAQLARFFRTNETKISAEQISKCLEHLPAIESSALDRLFLLLYPKKTPKSRSPRLGDIVTASKELTENELNCPEYAQSHPPSPASYLGGDDWHASPRDGIRSRCGSVHTPRRSNSSLLPFCSHPCSMSPQDCSIDNSVIKQGQHLSHPVCGNEELLVQGEFDNSGTPQSSYSENITLLQAPCSAKGAASSTIGNVAAHPAETTIVHDVSDSDTHCEPGLATLNEIKFVPSTKRLLEDCTTDRGKFLQAVREAKVIFPNGQGWEAAIAMKKRNADSRDLMKIYHRFECHNIYRHVVEAGFHTGSHWIRDMRASLAAKLHRDFPQDFEGRKTANKCLNWVDQGCKYREWAETFSGVPNLGYLIALPSGVSHSMYTSRCSREQMNAAVPELKRLGIDEIVKSLQLSELGDHIAESLRDMTNKKRKSIDEGRGQSLRKSPRLTPYPDVQHLTAQIGGDTPALRFSGADYHSPFNLSIESPTSTLVQELHHDQQNSSSNNFVADDCMGQYDPFRNVELNSPSYSELFLGENSAFSVSFDEWNPNSSHLERLSQTI